MTKKVIMPCGCTVQDIGLSLAMQWCPMHDLAPDMLSALMDVQVWLNEFGEHAPIYFGGEENLAVLVDAIIRKIKGD